MDIKQVLKGALDQQIKGDKDGFANAMKQVLSAKVKKLVAENSGINKRPSVDAAVELDEFEYQGEYYGATVGVDVGHYSPATRGNYSPVAGDPSEYWGDPEEREWHIVWLDLYDEDGGVRSLTPEEIRQVQLTDSQIEQVDDALDKIRDSYDDFDEPDFDDPY